MADTEARYLVFVMLGRRYAFDLAQVAEICEPPQVWPIPTAPRCYAGAMNFHGAIVAVMNLAEFLGLAGRDMVGKTIVLDSRIASLAFLVENVVRIVPAGHASLMPPPGENHAVALIRLADGDAILLDAAAISDQATETING